MNFLGLSGPAALIDFAFASTDGRHKKLIQRENGAKDELYIFEGNEPVSGVITITPKRRKVDHIGVKIELVGQIEHYEQGNINEFTAIVRELDGPGTITRPATYNFNFSNVEKEYESYNGINVRLRYFLRVAVTTQYAAVTAEQDFWVENIYPPPLGNEKIRMNVGIDNYLHIEFEYEKQNYHLTDIIKGNVAFILVKIKIKMMELTIQKREVINSTSKPISAAETLTKFEIMDGAPVAGEKIPVRLNLHNYKLGPTYRNVNNQYSVRYFLHLVLIDEQDRRYFKQQEVTFWRKTVNGKALENQVQNMTPSQQVQQQTAHPVLEESPTATPVQQAASVPQTMSPAQQYPTDPSQPGQQPGSVQQQHPVRPTVVHQPLGDGTSI